MQSRFDSVFRVGGLLLEDESLENVNVGNENKNLPGENVCSCLTAGVLALLKNKMFFWINTFKKL